MGTERATLYYANMEDSTKRLVEENANTMFLVGFFLMIITIFSLVFVIYKAVQCVFHSRRQKPPCQCKSRDDQIANHQCDHVIANQIANHVAANHVIANQIASHQCEDVMPV